jgi:hypothetical protein
MNLDGRLFKPVLSKGLNKPFMLLVCPKHSSEDTTWVEFYKNLRGPKFELAVKGTVHGSFTGYPQLISALDLPEAVKKGAEHLFGSVDGPVLEKHISETVTDFMKICFGDGESKQIEKVSDDIIVLARRKLP